MAEHVSDRLSKKKTRHLRERVIEFMLFSAAAFSVLITLGIVYVLVSESVNFFEHISLWDFLTDTQWTPLFDDAHYGIMVLLSGTVVSSLVALAVAVPLGTIVAIYLSEFAPCSVCEVAKALLELLSGVPTVVYVIPDASRSQADLSICRAPEGALFASEGAATLARLTDSSAPA